MQADNEDMKRRTNLIFRALDGLSPHDAFGIIGGVFGYYISSYRSGVQVEPVENKKTISTETKIEYMPWPDGLKVRISNALRAAEINTASDLVGFLDRGDNLLRLKYIGRKAEKAIHSTLVAEGLR